MDERVEDLLANKLCSGDRPSVISAGTAVAFSIRSSGKAFFMTDALGRVVLLSLDSVKVLHPPLIKDDELDTLTDDTVISIMSVEGRSEDEIIEYFQRRKTKGLDNAP